jgi:hypothetical protein
MTYYGSVRCYDPAHNFLVVFKKYQILPRNPNVLAIGFYQKCLFMAKTV